MKALVVCPVCGYHLVGVGETPGMAERAAHAGMAAHEAERHQPKAGPRVVEPWVVGVGKH